MNKMLELLLSRSCAQNIYRMLDVRACASSIKSVTWHFRSQFLTDLLDENVYVTQFENFVENSTFICHLIKILYDLKQTFRVWYEIINAFLKKFDFVIFETNHNVFISKNDKIYVIVYIDDLLIINDDMKFIDFIKKKFDKKFKMIDLNFAQHYFDIEIVRNDDSILLR